MLALAVWNGWRQGFVVQICSLAGIVAGIWIAARFGAQVGGWLRLDAEVAAAGGFVTVLVAVILVVAIAGRLVRKVFHFAGLGIADTLLGIAVSVLKYLLVLSVLFYRPFCKWLCPLGAFYALLNKVSLFQMKVDGNKCVSCGKCARACKMDVDVTKTPNHTECIRCGMCIRACPTKAVCFRYGFGDGKDKAKAAETLQTNNNNKEE